MVCEREIVTCETKDDLAERAAISFARIISQKVKMHGKCFVALSGGSTPILLYEKLRKPAISNTIPWSKIHFFVSDERCVPLSSHESNFGNASRELFSYVPILQKNLHPCLNPEKDAEAAASHLESEIRSLMLPGKNSIPRFDLLLLGMGPDGHTASLFPGTKALDEHNKLVVKNHVEKLNADRITFTFPLINEAAVVMFLIAGEDKSKILPEILGQETRNFPSQFVSPSEGRLLFYLDKEAARNLASVSV